MADEPTGNLEPKTVERVFGAVMKIVRQSGPATPIATHNHDLAQAMDRRIVLADGLISEG